MRNELIDIYCYLDEKIKDLKNRREPEVPRYWMTQGELLGLELTKIKIYEKLLDYVNKNSLPLYDILNKEK